MRQNATLLVYFISTLKYIVYFESFTLIKEEKREKRKKSSMISQGQYKPSTSRASVEINPKKHCILGKKCMTLGYEGKLVGSKFSPLKNGFMYEKVQP